jgi:hypothetical protein
MTLKARVSQFIISLNIFADQNTPAKKLLIFAEEHRKQDTYQLANFKNVSFFFVLECVETTDYIFRLIVSCLF